MENTTNKTTSLPPIKTLFDESLEMFKGSLLNVFILLIISIVIFVVIFIVGAIVTIPLGVFSIISAIQSQSLTPAFFASLGGLGVVVGLLMIVSFVISLALQAATILVVADYKQKPEIGKSIKQGFSFVIPMFLASIITGFIIGGGYLLFVIPGILFQIALYFVLYEIVLNKKGVLAACRRSMGIVFANFWGILGRVLLLVVAFYGVYFLITILAGVTGSDSLQGIVSLILSLTSFLFSFFAISFVITLYRQAEKAAPAEKTGKLLWPILVAVIGWIVGILLTVAVLYTLFTVILPSIQNAAKNKDTMKMMQELQKGEDANPNVILQMLPTGSPERAQLQKELESMEKHDNSGSNASNSMMMER